MFLAAASAFAADTPPYLDPGRSVDVRVRDLLSRLTLDEKASLMKNGAAGVPRLGIPRYDWWNEALHGVARAGIATVFPQAIGMAATWDDDLVRREGDVIGIEARAKYNDAIRHGNRERYYGLTFWSPNINIFRDPRWGRGQETYGEDPFLTSRIGVAFVRGVQGDDPRYLKAAACAKHFVVHSGPEPLRHRFDAEPPEADFHETYLPAFEALVREAHVAGVMTAYNSLYGKPCAINSRLYDLLYRQWGFDGYVVSDCGAIRDLYTTYKVARDAASAEALAVGAGLCLRCGEERPAIASAVRRGLLKESAVDTRLGQLLATMFRLGFFDPPDLVPYSRIPISENDSPAHRALALRAARESIVLLKNDGVLPFRRGSLKRLAVIGPNADSLAALLGNYNGTPSAPVTVLAGLRAAVGPGTRIVYERGCDWVGQPAGLVTVPPTVLQMDALLTGLKGEYFPNLDLGGKAAIRRDRPIDFDWSRSGPPAGIPADRFSARWTGRLLTGTAGTYRLSISAAGGIRLTVGGTRLMDAWTPGEKTVTADAVLPENDAVPIQIEYCHEGEGGGLVLRWAVPPAGPAAERALAAARQADAIVFVGGLTAQLEGEEMPIDVDGFRGGDRTRIELPAVQEELVERLAAEGKPLVVALLSGSALAVPWIDAHADAVVEAWYPGQAGGAALADVLLGAADPAGRLPVTFYRSTEDLPAFTDYRMAGRTYRYFGGKPLYAFGHGLSYTRFDYRNLRAEAAPAAGSEQLLTISVDVSNTGGRDGDEVVQLYAREPASSEPRARESLCGFRRIHLAAGQTRTVAFHVTRTALRRWSVAGNAYFVPSGSWSFLAGAASDDIRQSVAVDLP